MQSDWLEMVAREGTVGQIMMVQPDEDGDGDGDEDGDGDGDGDGSAGEGSDDLPCPACGTAAPLVDGECSDCGLFLGE